MEKNKTRERKFRVILKGLGAPRETFVKKMAARGVDPKILARFLGRMPVVVRRGLDKDSAIKYGRLLAKAGAKVKVTPDEEPEVVKVTPDEEPEEEKVIELPPFEPDITYKVDRTPFWLLLGGLAALIIIAILVFYPKSYRLRISLKPGDEAYYTYSSETVSKFFRRRTRNPDATVVVTADMNLYQEVKGIRQGLIDIAVTMEHVDLNLEVKARSPMDHSLVDRRLRETEKGLEGHVLSYRVDRRGRLASTSSANRPETANDQMVRLIERAMLGIVLPDNPVKIGQWWTHRIADERFYFMELKAVERVKGRRCALIEVATRKSPLVETESEGDPDRVKSDVRVNGQVYLDLATGRVVLMDSEMTSVQKKVSKGKGDPSFVVLTEGSVRLELE